MARSLRRSYAAGWLQRFYLPLISVFGCLIGSGALLVGAGCVVFGVAGAAYTLFVGAIWLGAGIGAWRARRIGIWTSGQELAIRSLGRTTRLPRDQVVDVRVERRGAHRLGRSNCPVIYTDSQS